MHQPSKTSLLDRVDHATRSRGERYFREGRIHAIEWHYDDEWVSAKARGSGGLIYDVMAKVDVASYFTRPARALYGVGKSFRVLSGDCTCPVGTDCKHLVALAFVLAEGVPETAGEWQRRTPARSGPAPANPRPDDRGLPSEITRWIGRLRSAEAEARDEAKPFPSTVRDRLVPVIDLRAHDGAVTVEVVKVRLGRDDRPTGRPRRYDPDLIHRSGPRPQFLRPADLALLERLARSHTTLPDGEPGITTLRTALATGRARWRSLDGPLLRAGSTRRGRFAWVTGEASAVDTEEAARACRQRLVLREAGEDPAEPGRVLEVLPLAPPWYLDPDTGETGPVETGYPPGVARLLAMAPAVPAESADAVAEALAGLEADRSDAEAGPATRREPRHASHAAADDAAPEAPSRPALPLPVATDIRERRDLDPKPVLHLRTAVAHVPGCSPVTLPLLALRFDYGPAGEAAPSGADVLRHREAGALVLTHRDRAVETEALDALWLAAGGFGFVDSGEVPSALDPAPGRDPADLVFLPASLDMALAPGGGGDDDPEATAEEVATTAMEAMTDLRAELEAAGWRVAIAGDWPWALHEGPVSFSAGASMLGEDTDWFALALTLEADGQSLDLLPLVVRVIAHLPLTSAGRLEEGFDLAEFLSGLALFPALPDGARVRLDGERLAPIVAAVLEAQGLAEGRFHAAEAGRALRLAEALAGCGVPWRGDPRLIDLGERLRTLAEVGPAEPPAGLTADLRPYQRTGYAWLSALAETGFGAVLADEMGLGKTVQTLALLVHRHLEIGQDRPSLLVVPTSLVPTWTREAERFAPGLRLLVLHGPARHDRMDAIADAHVVLTTYPLLHRDIDRLAGQPFDLAVLDEAQAVKNPAAAIAGHIRRLDARTRLALTGTPVENALLDLWALFDWLIPGLLGHRAGFTRVFRTPIERHGDPRARATLAARVAPFVLRRTKASVAAELPARTEIDEPVTLQGGQRALYESLRVAMDARVRRAIAEKGVEGSRITILDALLKLRQAACDPALVKLAAARKVTESAKRARLTALLDAVLSEGRQVLVFSQFVAFLRLVEADLAACGWSYTKLTGQTRDREGAVARFQSGDASVFLISLKAGGTGLTLTAADTVVLLDPWWNPAAERQAMDRAHRIGQDKPVFVHRLIAEGTVETAIRGLQARKQALAAGVFGEGDERLPTALDETDIAALFAPIE